MTTMNDIEIPQSDALAFVQLFGIDSDFPVYELIFENFIG